MKTRGVRTAETSKNDKYNPRLCTFMDASGRLPAVQRAVTGNKCEVPTCRATAVWLVKFGFQSSHWCSAHTRAFMKDPTLWKEPPPAGRVKAGFQA